MVSHCSVAAFLLMALLATTAAVSATDAGLEKGAVEYIARRVYMVTVKPPMNREPVFWQYCLDILRTALGSEEKARQALVRIYRTGFTAKLTPAQVLELKKIRAVQQVQPIGKSLQDDMSN